MDIRIAEIKDAPVIHDLMMRAFDEYRKLTASSTALDETVETVTADMNGGEKAMICYMDGLPCAAVRFELKEDALYFFRFSVVPEYQRRGIAKAMHAAMIDYALSLGLHKMQCKVRMNIEKNMRFYLSLGYVQYHQDIHELSGIALDVAWMEKELVPAAEGTSDLPVLNA